MDLPLGRRRLLSTAAGTAGGSTADGAKVITWHTSGGTNQEWQIIAL
jgi:hypothetical protein